MGRAFHSTQFDFGPDAVLHAALLAIHVAQHFQALQVPSIPKNRAIIGDSLVDVAHPGPLSPGRDDDFKHIPPRSIMRSALPSFCSDICSRETPFRIHPRLT
jgi:hypothetical protein